MAVRLGVHADRLAAVRALRTVKGRRESGRFAFEGPTLLSEARRSGFPIDELYVTQEAYDAQPLVRELDEAGTAVFIVDSRSAAKISDVEAPPGIVAVGPMRLAPLEPMFAGEGIVLVLADLNDPGNAGALLRSAEAFGCRGVVAGRLGADPYHPKVVRAAMGSVFRMAVAVADPPGLQAAARGEGFEVAGLSALGEPLGATRPARQAIVVGHERHGLGRWEGVCDRLVAIPMPGRAESLNAAVAGSVALYEATKGPPRG